MKTVLETVNEYLPNAADVKETAKEVIATVSVPKAATPEQTAEALRCKLRQASSRAKYEG